MPNSHIKKEKEKMVEKVNNTQDNPSVAPIVKIFDDLFGMFNTKYFESALSKPVISISQKGTRKAMGWFTTKRVWKNGNNNDEYFEINICPEYLYEPIAEVCITLLHEMVHLCNALNDIKDCSRQSQYHNKSFKDCAERHGLRVDGDKYRGFSETSLTPETLRFIQSLDLTTFSLFRNTVKDKESGEENGRKSSSTRKYICPNCGTSVRATKNVQIKCMEKNCDVFFVLQKARPKNILDNDFGL
jgi:hypothetical protein